MKIKSKNLVIDMNPKLLLFDIDGTLISARGLPKTAMGNVLKKRYNSFTYDQDYDFSGRTDHEIIEYLLKFDNRKFTDLLIKEILQEFCLELQHQFTENNQPKIHPGVSDLIKELNSMPNVFLGLVTGNIAKGARIKLEAANLYHYFPIGGFGDDSKHRSDLPPIAMTRAEAFYDIKFKINDIWIIGDSIHDITCAQENNLRCLAVTTGWTSRETLSKKNPEFLETDLSDFNRILEILFSDNNKSPKQK